MSRSTSSRHTPHCICCQFAKCPQSASDCLPFTLLWVCEPCHIFAFVTDEIIHDYPKVIPAPGQSRSMSPTAYMCLCTWSSTVSGMQGVKLYYNVLEAMLAAEESRTHQANFTSLLSSNSFHKCLAACAFELIVASYKMVRCVTEVVAASKAALINIAAVQAIQFSLCTICSIMPC